MIAKQALNIILNLFFSSDDYKASFTSTYTYSYANIYVSFSIFKPIASKANSNNYTCRTIAIYMLTWT